MTADLSPQEAAAVARFDAADTPPEIEVISRMLDVAEALDGEAKEFSERAARLREAGHHDAADVRAAEALVFRNAANRVRQALTPHVPETEEREA